jgi:hypothetical protein
MRRGVPLDSLDDRVKPCKSDSFRMISKGNITGKCLKVDNPHSHTLPHSDPPAAGIARLPELLPIRKGGRARRNSPATGCEEGATGRLPKQFRGEKLGASS